MESGPLRGEEAAPGTGHAAWYEDHVTLDVAWAFAQYAHATGDRRFAREDAARVLYGVADWICSRVARRRGGYDIHQAMGIAERKKPSDNETFTVMSAKVVLREAIECAERLGDTVLPAWREVYAGLEPPRNSRSGALTSHEGYHPNEEKGATPGPLAGLFPLWYDVEPEVARATLEYYLGMKEGYIGSPMLSAFYGVWAAWAGDRELQPDCTRRATANWSVDASARHSSSHRRAIRRSRRPARSSRTWCLPDGLDLRAPGHSSRSRRAHEWPCRR